MLLSITVENILSFRERTEISFAPVLKNSKYNPKNHVIEDTKTGAKALRLGVFFGANASGKTNIIKALDILKDIATGEKVSNIKNIKHFNSKEKSSIALEFCHDQIIYRYSVIFLANKIIEEKLEYKEKLKNNYYEIFKRMQDEFNSSGFSQEIEGLSLLALQDEAESSLSCIASNRFLFKKILKEIKKNEESFGGEDVKTEILEKLQEEMKKRADLLSDKDIFLKHIKNAYDFFEDDLRIIFPKMSVSGGGLYILLKEKDGFQDFLKNLLADFDTGICDIDFEELGQEFILREVFDNDKEEKEKFEKKIKDKIVDSGVISSQLHRIFVKKEGDRITYHALKTIHVTASENIIMNYGCNSDGTKRLIDLAMLFFHETKSAVTVIDEIENSLHPHIVHELVERFTNNESFNNAQLLLATHAEYLFDQDVLRKDEIYVVEKKPHGNSVIERLTEIADERFDKNLRLTYNKGYYGGIPNIF